MDLHSTRWLALGYFTYFFSYGIFLPFWSVWLEGLGLTPETIGLLLGAGLIVIGVVTIAVFVPAWGWAVLFGIGLVCYGISCLLRL